MIRTMVGTLAIVILTLGSLPPARATTQSGTVLDVRVTSRTLGNPTHFLLSGVRSSRAGCAFMDWWAIDTDTPTGRNFLATILAAQASQRVVTIWGTDACEHVNGMESVKQIGVAQ